MDNKQILQKLASLGLKDHILIKRDRNKPEGWWCRITRIEEEGSGEEIEDNMVE